MSDNFQKCFAWTVGIEGGYTNSSSDPGNWTGGKVGSGHLLGTKFGISAASYPTLDIANLTAAEAQTIYKKDYWPGIHGDELPLAIARVAFDGAVNSGTARTILWLQAAAGVVQDGNFGPVTLAALLKADAIKIASDVLAYRLIFMSSLSNWKTYQLGWTRRVIALSQIIDAEQTQSSAANAA